MSTLQFPFLPDHNRLIAERYQKVDRMREAGVSPYPAQFEATDLAQDLLADAERLIAEARPVAVLGRVLGIRQFGKAAFFHLRDRSGKIQVYVKHGETSDEGFRIYREFLDGGDIAGVRGVLFRTRTGEVTVQAKELVLAAKAVRQLPDKWHGLTDVETRYRQRYVDMIANPEVVETFRTRSRILSTMRRLLDEMGFMEVETPMMHPIVGGAAARPFVTHHNTLDTDLFLRIAPELYLKRLVVGGLDRVYEINRNFRNEGISTRHNPEFTMLELYAGGWDCSRMMDFTEALVRATAQAATGRTEFAQPNGNTIDFGKPFARLTILEAIETHLGFALAWDMSVEEIRRICPGVQFPHEMRSAADAIMFLLEGHLEEKLVQPTFLRDFPKAVSPLAKSVDGAPDVADRFELYANCMEIANAYSELNDPREQYQCFAEQVARKKAGDDEAMAQIDEDYVRALEYGMPPTAGLGIGIDRIVMLFTQQASIRDVVLFPLMKPEPLIVGIEHHEDGSLDVTLRGEGTRRYRSVPKETVQALHHAPNRDAYFMEHIASRFGVEQA
jgi:lysyl-tRNA synthetase class 2